MSLEAWGDDGDAREPPPGWWTDCTVSIVQDCIKDLFEEPVYEEGKKENGISVRFLARLTLLRGEAELLDTKDPLYKEAEAMFAADAPAGERLAARDTLREVGPYPGMAEAFQTRYGVPFEHSEWREEAATWAASWKATLAWREKNREGGAS